MSISIECPQDPSASPSYSHSIFQEEDSEDSKTLCVEIPKRDNEACARLIDRVERIVHPMKFWQFMTILNVVSMVLSAASAYASWNAPLPHVFLPAAPLFVPPIPFMDPEAP